MQGISAEVIAEKWNLSREELDRYSLESHLRAARAIDEGRFEQEIVPVELDVPAPDSARRRRADDGAHRFAVDEAVRRETSIEALAALQPAFRAGRDVTAGNSTQIVDGSAAVLIASERRRPSSGCARGPASSASASPASTRPDAARQPGGVRARAREGGAHAGTTSR